MLSIHSVEATPYTLTASLVGYHPMKMRLSLSERNMDLGTVTMTADEQLLAGVTVTAKGKVLADGYTIFPTRQAQTQANTGYEFLRKLMIPDLKVDLSTNTWGTMGLRWQVIEDVLTLTGSVTHCYYNMWGRDY